MSEHTLWKCDGLSYCKLGNLIIETAVKCKTVDFNEKSNWLKLKVSYKQPWSKIMSIG